MIYTVTFNPAVDYVMIVDDFRLGRTNRSRQEETSFGGKGINVSLVLHELGLENTALGFVAGITGSALEEYLEGRGIPYDFVRLPTGMTRINIKLKTDRETEINANGPEISAQALDALLKKIEQIRSGDTLVLAGSVPASLPSDIYEMILQRLQGREIRTVVDAERELLCRTLSFRPFLIKPNRAELAGIVGKSLSTEEEVIAAAKELRGRGACNVLVSLGKDGALLLDEHGTVHRSPTAGADIPPVNTVGAGDSMVAGFLGGLSQGYEYALKLGIAAGSATACSPNLADRETIEHFLKELTGKTMGKETRL